MASSLKAQNAKTDAEPAPLHFPCGECGRNLRVPAALAGKKVRCPKCHKPTLAPVPDDEPVEAIVVEPEEIEITVEPDAAPRQRIRVMPILATLGVILVVIACSAYANLSFAVTKGVNYKYFPPFKPHVNANWNRHLGAEYFHIAKSMVAGEGFSSPFKEKTGPTAWMPPILPTILAGLLWACDENVDAVMTVCLFLQGAVLIGTGLLILALAWQTTERLGVLLVFACFLVGLLSDFRQWFQMTHDTSLVLLALDVLVVGFAWCKPLLNWRRAALWGLVGGTVAMINPITAMVWGVLTFALMIRERAWYRFGVAVLLAAVTLTPWTVRNYLVFGKFIPVKSNAAYELFQSQLRQKDGLLRDFHGHPYGGPGPERTEYKALGEIEFIEKRRAMFWEAVRADPLDFVDRVACRFMGATIWYVPFNRADENNRPVIVWTSRVLHPAPFLALIFLAMTAVFKRLHWVQWLVMGAYLLYLGPYIGVSYYERYAMPLLAIKVLLVVWAIDRFLAFIWPVPAGEAETLVEA